jgi:hypothetical protein
MCVPIAERASPAVRPAFLPRGVREPELAPELDELEEPEEAAAAADEVAEGAAEAAAADD